MAHCARTVSRWDGARGIVVREVLAFIFYFTASRRAM
jgi:hypothetical protein